MSSVVTFYLFVVPALRKMAGWKQPRLTSISVKVSTTEHVMNVQSINMEIYVHSTLEVGRKERQPRQTRHITPRPDKHDTQHTDQTNKTYISCTYSHAVQMGFSISLDSRPEYHRAMINWSTPDHQDLPTASSTGSQCSSRLLSMCTANTLLVLPARSEQLNRIEAGAVVKALLLGPTL